MGSGSGGERLSYALALHTTKGTLGGGNSFRENLPELLSVAPLNKNGLFGSKSPKSRRNVRVIECTNPARSAYEFAQKATKGFVSMTTIPGKGYIMRMYDGTLITYRYISSSPDKSPVVELKINNFKRVKSQKIHFVKGNNK